MDLDYLCDLAGAVVDASRVVPGQCVAGSPANTTGGTLIRPGGRDCYPSCWVRDFAMSLDAGCITAEEMSHHLRLFALTQHGPRGRRLKSGGIIPPFSIADHVNFDGIPVFFPGTYAADETQGGEPWGVLPPVDDHYYFIRVAHRLWKQSRSAIFLNEHINGIPLIQRLILAFDAPTSDPATGAVLAEPKRRAVGFGFFDSVYMTGAMLMPTLLRYEAALELAELCHAINCKDVVRLSATAARVKSHIPSVFAGEIARNGWLVASTGHSAQSDVWGTLLALYLRILPEGLDLRTRQTVSEAVRSGEIEHCGAVRHVPCSKDASMNSAWERCVFDHQTYQNGAYWHTPTGWLIDALLDCDRALAEKLFERYIEQLQHEDFRRGSYCGAPWECFGRDGEHQRNPIYMTSVTLPLGVLRKRR